MAEQRIYSSHSVFKAIPDGLGDADRDVVAKEASGVLDQYEGRVKTRGVYATAAFTAHADLMLWWIARSVDDLQDLLGAFRHTQLGRSLIQTQAFLGLVRPAEFTPDHAPAFVTGAPPKKILCVYPFVRAPQWYLLAPAERGRMLAEHGMLGREYPDVLTNTTSAFGLGDYEWILAFEAESPDRLVDLIRRLRANESRRYVRLEVPFVTGIRRDVSTVVSSLP
jgi:hydrogen peroxide-dependent heme synthase